MTSMIRLHTTTDQPSLGDPSGHFWTKVSTSFIADVGISDAELRVLAALVALVNPAGICEASNARIGQACGKAEGTVGRLLKTLEGKQLVDREPHGPWRKIRLNFSFRGGSYPVRSEEVKPVVTPAEVRTNPTRTEDLPRQKRGPTPALPTTILRFEPETEDPRLDRESATAGQGQAPPPPPPEEAEAEQGITRLDYSQAPDPLSLPEDLRKRCPVDVPAGTRFEADRIRHTPARRIFPEPIRSNDLLSAQELAQARQVIAQAGRSTMAHAVAFISISRNNKAVSLSLRGELPKRKEEDPLLALEVGNGSSRNQPDSFHSTRTPSKVNHENPSEHKNDYR